MRYYPVFLDLRGRRCIVIGGGDVAERKVLALLDAGAEVTVISPELTAGLDGLKRAGRIEHAERRYQDGDLEGAFIVIAATSDMEVNRKVSRDAGNIPVNVVDVPDLCTFIVPSVVRRGDLTIAVSTSGASPALSRSIREEMEGLYTEDFSILVRHLARIRKALTGTDMPPERRTHVLKRLGSREVLRILRTEGPEAALRHVEDTLRSLGLESLL
ncbi:MAG: bifunctional precorrin-2 dehydrogenase/sirohydrochlorin ferrochelatase [Nitrospirae bacterium]|nr:bifunctional precorrin-2 dehydrogenase/sirohydrochlorin ferrochelatase [Nitrospirota bacterium]